MSRLTRRDWLQACALVGSLPCACLGKSSTDCCSLSEVPAGAIRIESGLITIDLAQTPGLSRVGSALKVVDPGRKLQVIVARPTKHGFVALDQKCTHGGGALTYVHRHKHLYCAC